MSAHTILESDLSKGYHEECFDLFLMMNAYISQNYCPVSHEQGEEEPPGLAGLMATTGPEPAIPQNTLAQGNPGYAVLTSLEPKIAAELEKQLHKGQDGYHMEQPVNMLLEKFYFDRKVNCTGATMEDRALVFDEMCASLFKKERFLRMYHEVNNSGANLAEIKLPGNQYLGMWEKLPATIGAMHQLCALLGSARHKTWMQNSQQHSWWPKQISLLLSSKTFRRSAIMQVPRRFTEDHKPKISRQPSAKY